MPSSLAIEEKSEDSDSKTLKNPDSNESENEISNPDVLLNQSTVNASSETDGLDNHNDADTNIDAICEDLKLSNGEQPSKNNSAVPYDASGGIVTEDNDEEMDDKSEKLGADSMLSKRFPDGNNDDINDEKSEKRCDINDINEKMPEIDSTENHPISDDGNSNTGKKNQDKENTHDSTTQSVPSEKNGEAENSAMEEKDLKEESKPDIKLTDTFSGTENKDMDNDSENKDTKSKNEKATNASDNDGNDNDDMQEEAESNDSKMNCDVAIEKELPEDHLDGHTKDNDEDKEDDDPKSENDETRGETNSGEDDTDDNLKGGTESEGVKLKVDDTTEVEFPGTSTDVGKGALDEDNKKEEVKTEDNSNEDDINQNGTMKEDSKLKDNKMMSEITTETDFPDTFTDIEDDDLDKQVDSNSEGDKKSSKGDSDDSDENGDGKENLKLEDSSMTGDIAFQLGIPVISTVAEVKPTDEKVDIESEDTKNVTNLDSVDNDENVAMKEDSVPEEKKNSSKVALQEATNEIFKEKKIKSESEDPSYEEKSQELKTELDKSKAVKSEQLDSCKDTKNKETTNIGSSQSNKTSSKSKETRTHVGRKGDPRMHASVAAKIGNSTLKLFEALIQGGFEYSCDKDTEKDKDGVTLVQRKNQLRRRLRKLNIPRDNKVTRMQALLAQSRTNPMSMQGTTDLKNPEQAMKYPLLPMALPYQAQNFFQMAQQFGFPFQPGLTVGQQGNNDKSTNTATTQGNGNNDAKSSIQNQNQDNSFLKSTQSKTNDMVGDKNKIQDFPITPYFPAVSTFGYPPFQNLLNLQPQNPSGQDIGKDNGKDNQNDSKKNGDKSLINDETLKDTAKDKSETTEVDENDPQKNTKVPFVDKTKLNKSCDRCRKRKVKCNGEIPCNVCVHDRNRLRKKKEKVDGDTPTDDNFGIRCVYSYSLKRGPPAGKSEKRKRKKNDKPQQENSTSTPFQGVFPQQQLNPAMHPQFFNPIYGQVPNANPPNSNTNNSNMPILPNNMMPFNNTFPPYPLPFTNNPVTDSIYSQAILAAARSVLMTSQNQPDDSSGVKTKLDGGTNSEKNK